VSELLWLMKISRPWKSGCPLSRVYFGHWAIVPQKCRLLEPSAETPTPKRLRGFRRNSSGFTRITAPPGAYKPLISLVLGQ
jgi:hypothetical protein